MDHDTPFFRNLETKRASKMIYNIVLGFKGKLVDELKYPIYEALHPRADEQIESKVRKILSNETQIQSLFSRVANEHHKQLETQSKTSVSNFARHCQAVVDAMLSGEGTKELYSRYHELRANEWSGFLKERETDHHKALSAYRSDITKLENRLTLTEGRQASTLAIAITTTAAVFCTGAYIATTYALTK